MFAYDWSISWAVRPCVKVFGFRIACESCPKRKPLEYSFRPTYMAEARSLESDLDGSVPDQGPP